MENCPQRLYVASVGGSGNLFRIKTYTANHSCTGILHAGHKQATMQFIADWILSKVKDHPRYRPTQIVQDVKRELRVEITYSKALRAKELVLEAIHSSFEDAYQAMPKYCADIEKTNPGSLTKLDISFENRFRRVFIAYGASCSGFAHCRPLLGLDGTHLKTRYQGILLAATAVDAKGQLFPVAFAIVDAENNANWLWMLQLLRRIVETHAPHFLDASKVQC